VNGRMEDGNIVLFKTTLQDISFSALNAPKRFAAEHRPDRWDSLSALPGPLTALSVQPP